MVTTRFESRNTASSQGARRRHRPKDEAQRGHFEDASVRAPSGTAIEGSLLNVAFGPDAERWLAKQSSSKDKEALTRTADILAHDSILRERLAAPEGKHSMELVIHRCIELDCNLGTTDLRKVRNALASRGVICEFAGLGMKSFMLVSAELSCGVGRTMIQDPQFKTLSREDRFVALVTVLREQEAVGGNTHCSQIHSGLPKEVKKEVKKINLPLTELLSLRKGLRDQRITDLRNSDGYTKADEEERFVQLVETLEKNGLLGSSTNCASIYSGFPKEVKEEVACIKLPLTELLSLRKGLGDQCITALRASDNYKEADKEERIIQLLDTLEKKGFLGSSTNCAHIYSGLPQEVKKEVACVNLPLTELRSLREGLRAPCIAELRASGSYKEADKEERSMQLLETLEENGLLGSSTHCGSIHCGLTNEVKEEVAFIGLSLTELRSLRKALRTPCIAELRASDGYTKADKEERFIQLVETLEKSGLLGSSTHCGNLYSGLPRELKEDVACIDLPLTELRSLRKALRAPCIAELRVSDGYIKADEEERSIQLLDTLEEHKLLGSSTHCGKIYSGFPRELKEEVAFIDLPLTELRSLRKALRTPCIAELLASDGYTNADKEERFIQLVETLEKNGLLGSSTHCGQIYSGLPRELKEKVTCIHLPLTELLSLRKALRAPCIAELRASDGYTKADKEERFIQLVETLEENGLLGSSTNCAQIYSGLPKEVKEEVTRIDLPLPELLSLRKNLRAPCIADLRASDSYKKAAKEERFIQLVETLEENGLLGSSTNCGSIYSGLPMEVKEEVTKISLPLTELLSLRKGLRAPCIAQLRASDSYKKADKEERFVQLLETLEEHKLLGSSTNCGSIYSGLPKEVKEEVACIQLPLTELLSLRKGLRAPCIAKLRASDSYKKADKEERFIQLVETLEENGLLGSSTNCAQIYSGLPKEVKEEVACIQLPLDNYRAIRSLLKTSQSEVWIEENLGKYPKEERLQVLLTWCQREHGIKINRRQLFMALPNQLSKSIHRRDLTTACVRLDLPDQVVFFDSGEERVIGQLLFQYGLISRFIEGENLHVKAGTSRASLDFKIGSTFLEYHPLSIREQRNGDSLVDVGARKRESVSREKFPDHEVVHIWKFAQLFELLTTEPLNSMLHEQYRSLSRDEFLRDVKAARKHGHAIDNAVRAAQAKTIHDEGALVAA